MQKIVPLLVLSLVFSCSSEDNEEGMPVTAENDNPMEEPSPANTLEGPVLDSRNKQTIIAYLENLIANDQLLAGQQCGDAPDSTWWYYNTYVNKLADQTGRHIGLIGADFGWFTGTDYPVKALIDHWREGGLVTISWHADNPFVDAVDVYWDTVKDKDKINFKALLKDAERTKEWISYRTEINKVARALQELRNAGVTVIWRPFHEMNGDFFWWGTNANGNQQTNETGFKELWVDLYNTLRWDYELDNLIWIYSVVPSETWYAAVTAYYPGSDYVDLVGMDYYGTQPSFPHFEELKNLGKPLVMSESGPREAGYGNWDMMQLAEILKGKAAYFLQWHSWTGAKVAIKDNKNAIEMMNSPFVITRDEIEISQTLQ